LIAFHTVFGPPDPDAYHGTLQTEDPISKIISEEIMFCLPL